jgi:hypothetical protein
MKRFDTNEQLIRGYLAGYYEDGKTPNGNLFFEKEILYSYGYHFPLAVDLGRLYVLNGDKYSVTTSGHQSKLFRLVPNSMRVEIPFSALASMMTAKGKRIYAQSDVAKEVMKFNVIDWENDRYLDTGRLNKQGEPIMDHVLGGSLFEYEGSYFVTGMDLSGVDPRGMFFLTEIATEQIEKFGEPTSMVEAMELLKPDEIKKAEEVGCEVYRQGEHFFIEVTDKHFKVGDVQKPYMIKNMAEDREDRHYASEGFMMDGMQFVRGIVKHTGRQHRMLKLYKEGTKAKDRKWFAQHESVQANSWSASGNVD